MSFSDMVTVRRWVMGRMGGVVRVEVFTLGGFDTEVKRDLAVIISRKRDRW